MNPEPSGRFRFAPCLGLVAIAAFLPFVRGVVGGQSFYFRDLSGQFFPARRFLLDGVVNGELRFWNPFVHEGVPVSLSVLAYPLDLLQLLIPNEFGISLLLALHIPLAAVFFVLLARDLDLAPAAAATGALIYSLGGFSLSTLNLYVYVAALAWTPLFVLLFRRAVESGGSRAVALAGLVLALIVSTTGIEIAFQACIFGVVMAPPRNGARFLRSAAIAVLAIGLAAAIILPMLSLAGNSERGTGFATSVVLAHSIHPLALVQVVVAGLFGDISNLTGVWWGVNFFPRGFPYILSLYLGPLALILALAGVATKRTLTGRLVLLTAAAVVIGLGRYAGWENFFELSPALRFLRYPVKAFFTVQFCVALLASFGVHAIVSGKAGILRPLVLGAGGLGGIMVASLIIPTLAPGAATWFLEGFLPATVPQSQRDLILGYITKDAAAAGAVAIAAGLIGWAALRGWIPSSRAAVVIAALVGADLIRAGAGLNATVTSDFYVLSPDMAAQAEGFRNLDSRVFTCEPQSSLGYWQGRRVRTGRHEAFTMATMQETLTPDFNVPFGVRTALSIDRTMLAPQSRVLTPELANCRSFASIVPTLQNSGVTRVLSLDPLDDPTVRLLDTVTPQRIAPLVIHIYELSGALPRFSMETRVLRDTPDQLDLEVDAPAPLSFIVRDPFAAGWGATVNGVDQVIQPSADGHRELLLKPGRNLIRMTFHPEGLRAGIGISFAFLFATFGLLFRPRSHRRTVGPAPPSGWTDPST